MSIVGEPLSSGEAEDFHQGSWGYTQQTEGNDEQQQSGLEFFYVPSGTQLKNFSGLVMFYIALVWAYQRHSLENLHGTWPAKGVPNTADLSGARHMAIGACLCHFWMVFEMLQHHFWMVLTSYKNNGRKSPFSAENLDFKTIHGESQARFEGFGSRWGILFGSRDPAFFDS